MSKPKIIIDGKEGTTGFRSTSVSAKRDDVELLLIDEDKRKDTEERRKFLNAADIVFLCLPDAAAKEAVTLIENDHTRVIDASTAHRTDRTGIRLCGAVQGAPRRDRRLQARCQPGLPRERLHFLCLSARRTRRCPGGLCLYLLVAHRLFGRRQKDDRRI